MDNNTQDNVVEIAVIRPENSRTIINRYRKSTNPKVMRKKRRDIRKGDVVTKYFEDDDVVLIADGGVRQGKSPGFDELVNSSRKTGNAAIERAAEDAVLNIKIRKHVFSVLSDEDAEKMLAKGIPRGYNISSWDKWETPRFQRLDNSGLPELVAQWREERR